jgi:protease secretion system outer membrane protein
MFLLFTRDLRSSLVLFCLVLIFTPKIVLAVTLEEAIELAIKNNRQLKLSQARYRDAEELVPLAIGQLRPQVSLSASWSYVQQDQTNDSKAGQRQSYPSESQVLSLRQPLIRIRQVRSVEQAKAQVARAGQELRFEEQQLAVRLVSAYLEAQLALDKRKLVDGQMALVSGRLAAAKAGLKAGQGTRNDIDETAAELDRIRAQSIQIDQGIELSRRQLELIIEQPPGVLSLLNSNTFDPRGLKTRTLEENLDIALRESPQIQAAREDVSAAKAVLRQASAAHLPTLDFVAQAGINKAESGFFTSSTVRSTSVGLQLSVPLYTGGTLNAQERQNKARLDQVQETLQQLINKLRLDVQTEYFSIIQGLILIEALQRAVESSRQAVKSSQFGQLAGVRSNLDILRAQGALYQSEIELSQARYTYINSWVKLQGLIGLLSRESISVLFPFFKS